MAAAIEILRIFIAQPGMQRVVFHVEICRITLTLGRYPIPLKELSTSDRLQTQVAGGEAEKRPLYDNLSR